MTGGRYRSKLEVFRDLLVAARHASKKTRIIGLANLNPSTFKKHMATARAGGLVTVTDGEYRLTVKADRVLAALQQLMAKSTELDLTLQFLEQSGLPSAGHPWKEGTVLRQVSRVAWGDGASSSHPSPASLSRSGGFAPSTPRRRSGKREIDEILVGLIPESQSPSVLQPSDRRLPAGGPSPGMDATSRNLRRS
jgi:predicted transcriptional regulator